MGFKLKDFPKHVQDQVRGKDTPNGLDVCNGSQTLFINKLSPMLNGSDGLQQMHWSKYQKVKKKWVDYIFAKQPKRHIGKVNIRFTRVSTKTPDPDNVSAGFKVVGDALVDCGVIEDDSFDVIQKFDVRWEKADTMRSQGIRIEINDVEWVMSLLDKNSRLSDVRSMELAEEIARQKMPIKFKWEVNEKDSMTTVPEWIIKAMIDFRDKSNYVG